MKNGIIRKLTIDDLNAFLKLRLFALQNSPTSFLTSYEEEQKNGLAFFEKVLARTEEDNVIFGAFANKELIASIGIYQEKAAKAKHKCIIWGVYVHPDHRKAGIARNLLATAIQHAKEKMHCSVINLTVETKNIPATKLYQSLGFKIWGTEANAFYFNNQFYDEYHLALFFD